MRVNCESRFASPYKGRLHSLRSAALRAAWYEGLHVLDYRRSSLTFARWMSSPSTTASVVALAPRRGERLCYRCPSTSSS